MAFVANLVNVPTATGLGQTVVKVNAALYGRHWRPQPFPNALISLFEGSDVLLPEGYVGLSYDLDWHFLIYSTDMSIDSGSFPPGLDLSFPTPFSWTITGTPTEIGYYTVQLKVVVSQTVGYITLHIPILPNPTPPPPIVIEEGSGYIFGN